MTAFATVNCAAPSHFSQNLRCVIQIQLSQNPKNFEALFTQGLCKFDGRVVRTESSSRALRPTRRMGTDGACAWEFPSAHELHSPTVGEGLAPPVNPHETPLRAPIRLPPGGGSRQCRVEEPACKSNPHNLPSSHELYSICRQTDVRSNFLLTPHPPQAVPLPPLGKANCTFILSSYRTLRARIPFPRYIPYSPPSATKAPYHWSPFRGSRGNGTFSYSASLRVHNRQRC